ncbi:CLUMA_CG018188, isoform A [Clunio marinus]|uniref:CLUMA_CG018188, isoform A n=1 Tax=Clunio marinus TaxID=568069 RepID=A0A1J1IZN7_9DIPT|nr:CLUMA_CG018188, isoform A [Clunio marinus]
MENFCHFISDFQVHINMAQEQSMRVFRQASDDAREMAMRVIHDPGLNQNLNQIKGQAEAVFRTFLDVIGRIKDALRTQTMLDQLEQIFRDEISRNNTYFVLLGLGLGTAGGCVIGMWLARKNIANPIMNSVACVSYYGPDNVTLSKTNLPHLTSTSDILVRVRAVAISRLDVAISQGYGRTLRRILQNYHAGNPELPLVIGRSCSGVVENVGKDAKCGLEIGDEVWLASSSYEFGLASQLVVTNETRVSRKPVLIGFEGAASLPYDGCMAIHALKQAKLNENTSMGKKIFIQDGCSPVGCILMQLLKKWGGYIVVTCHQRSAPVVNALGERGADEIITFSNDSFEANFYEKNIEQSSFLNELLSRNDKYDVVFFTTHLNYNTDFITKFLSPNGIVIHATEKYLPSDNYNLIMRTLLKAYIVFKKIGCRLINVEPSWTDEPHLCHNNLELLASYVNDEMLNTVVDQVYNPQEAERAIAHVIKEDYELIYGEELEMLNEFDEETSIPVINDSNKKAGPIVSTQKTCASNKNATLLSSPALSQISTDGFCLTSSLQPRKQKFTSTPFLEKMKTLQTLEEDTENDPHNYEANQNKRKKRQRLEDLFGDIYDIDVDDVYAKKIKTEEERDLETIQRILEARQNFDKLVNPSKKPHFYRLEALHKFKSQNLSKTIPKFSFSTISNDEKRIYVRTHNEEFEEKMLSEIKLFDGGLKNLLGNERENIWQEANQIISKAYNENQDILEILPEIHRQNDSVDLLVDKYQPRKYVDLLSDEFTNRSLLQWLKLWDKIVYKRDVVKKTFKPGQLNSFNKKTGRFVQNGGWSRKQKATLNTELDANHVPVQKIALIVGKPGLGKTTLAHVIARHAGYDIREMNASDDCTVDNFRQALENGTQMTSVLNRDNRPNCIILDEIDGAPLPSIEFLIRFVSGQVVEKSKKGKNNKKFILKRPIICICNDMYGANMRNLRQIAFVLNINQIDSSRLADRLLHIARKEKVESDLTTMLALCEKTGSDIRSCISMIQFFSCSKKPLTLLDVTKSNIGEKDQHKSIFNIWSSIFQIQRNRKFIQTSNEQKQEMVGMSEISDRTRMDHVLKTVHSSSEYDRLIQGVHENFLTQKISDQTMSTVVEAHNWFCFNDHIQSKINNIQNYSIYSYLAYGFVGWHFLFATLTYPQIHFPHKSYEISQKKASTKMIFGTFKKGISSNLVGIGKGIEVMLDSISLLKIIISPEVRSVSMHLLSEKEKLDIKHTVEVIADLGLSFIQLQTADGAYTYRIDPDIEYLGETFSEKQFGKMSYWSKQAIAREVEIEKMRRAKPKVKKVQAEVSLEGTSDKISETPKTLPNHLQRLIPKDIKVAKPIKTVSKDFFGRITSKPSIAAQECDENSPDVFIKSPIWYKFKEGFNNAVRTDLTISDLL